MTEPTAEPVICLGGCGRRLTSRRSRARGYGTDCWRKRHGHTGRQPAISGPAHTDIHPDQTFLDLRPVQVTLWSL